MYVLGVGLAIFDVQASDAFYQVSSQLVFWFRRSIKKIFKMAAMQPCCHLGFLIRIILTFFNYKSP